MTYFVTRISLRGLNEEVRKKVIEACDYCVTHDKYGSFTFKVSEDRNSIYVTSPNRSNALKRSSYFWKKFKVHSNIIEEVNYHLTS